MVKNYIPMINREVVEFENGDLYIITGDNSQASEEILFQIAVSAIEKDNKKVLYLHMDDNRERLKVVSKEIQGALDNFKIANISLNGLESVLAFLESQKEYDVIILSSFYKLCPRWNKRTQDIGRTLKTIARKLNIPILVMLNVTAHSIGMPRFEEYDELYCASTATIVMECDTCEEDAFVLKVLNNRYGKCNKGYKFIRNEVKEIIVY